MCVRIKLTELTCRRSRKYLLHQTPKEKKIEDCIDYTAFKFLSIDKPIRKPTLYQSRTQSMPVRRLGAGHAQHLTCERAYSGYEIDIIPAS